MQAQQSQAEDLTCAKQVVHVRGRKRLARGTVTSRHERREVITVARVEDVAAALGMEISAVAPEPGGQNTIEHIRAAADGVDQILRCADAHHVSWSILRQRGEARVEQRTEQILRFADTQSTDGIALKAQGGQTLGALSTVGGVETTLTYPEHLLICPAMRPKAPLGPRCTAIRRLLRFLA